MNRRRILLAAAILVWTGGLALSVRPAHAQEDVLLAAYEEYVVGHPADTEKRLEYARALLDRGREGEAIEQFEAVLRDPRRERDALGHLVELYGGSERLRDQARAYARLLELAPERLDLRRALADLHFELDRPADGVDQLERILEARPGDLELRRELAGRYFWSDRPAEGISHLERILEARPGDLELRRELANHYFWSDRPAEGISHLERILEARPGDVELRRELANHYFWTDRFAEGISHLERVLEARPGDVELRRELARRHEEVDAPEKAADQYRILLEHSPGDSQALERLGEILMNLGREADAAVVLERLVAVDGTDLSARLRLAQALAWSDQTDPALDQLDVILARTPDEPRALLLAGELRRWKEAGWHRGKEHLHRLLAQEPEHPRARRLLKELRAERGPMVAPSVHRSSDSNQLTTTTLALEIAAWMTGDWRWGLHWERSALTDRREPSGARRSIHGLSTEFARSFSGGGILRGRMGFGVSPDSWTPITGQLEYRGRVSRAVSASVSAALSPVLGSALSIDRRILERRLGAETNVRPSERLEIWGAGSYSSFTDGNRGVMGAVGGQVNARLAAPTVALYGSYTYEDSEIVHSDSRPYWTPRDLSTLDAGVELTDSPVSWAELDLRLGLSRQDRTSYTYDVGIRLRPGDYHGVNIGFGRWGSDVYASNRFSLRYSYRLDFP